MLDNWIEELQAVQAEPYDAGLAEQIRVLSSLCDYAVLMCSGAATMPYTLAIRDGMTMNTRLVLHLDERDASLKPLLQQQTDKDIRVANHVQAIDSFLDDLSHHKVNILLLQWAPENAEQFERWKGMLAEQGLLVLFGVGAQVDELKARYTKDFFFSFTLNSDVLLMSKKGVQHRTDRRGGRARKRKP